LSKRTNVGIVGAGKMGLLHGSLLASTGKARIGAICERSSILRRFLPNLFDQAKVVRDLEDFGTMGLDAVYITTPIPTHFSLALEVMKGGLADHVFVEKTLTSSSKDSTLLAQMAGEGRITMVGYNRRFAVTFMKAKNLYEKGEVGEAKSFRAHAYSSDFPVSQAETAGSRGGVLRDLGSHAIDVTRWFLGEIRVSRGSVRQIQGGVTFEAAASTGPSGSISTSWSQVGYRLPEIGLQIIGTKGVLEASDDSVKLVTGGETKEWFRPTLQDNVPFLLGGPEYYREDEAFLEALGGSQRPQVDFGSALQTDVVIEEVLAS
jgi:predicted dehydrogenase